MSLEQLEQLAIIIIRYGFEAVVAGLVLFLLIKYFLPSYFSEKGKNLATKEDIEEITDKVESVRADYAHMLEELRSNNQQKLAAIEREKSIKKEVYLQAVEAITRTQNIVTSFSNLQLSEEKITSGMVNDSGIIAKVQIVGTEETVKSVTEFMAAIGSATLDLMLERSTLINRKNSIETLEKLRVKSANEVERYISIMKNVNLEGNKDPALWDTINKNIDFDQAQELKYSNEIDELWKIQKQEHIVFIRKCMARFFEISELLPHAVISVRKELDLEIPVEAYLDIVNNNIEKSKKVFENFLTKIENGQA